MALAIRQNPNIKGIPVEENELKIYLLADDSTCLLMAQITLLNHYLTLWKYFLKALVIGLMYPYQKQYGLDLRKVYSIISIF